MSKPAEPQERNVQIDTADTVLHKPTGETWIVAFVRDGRLSWCGWPEGFAELADCELVTAATDEERVKLLQEMAAMSHPDSRRDYARWRLGIRDAIEKAEGSSDE